MIFNKKHKKINVLCHIIAVLLILAIIVFTNVYFLFLHHYSGKEIINVWAETDEFNINNIKVVEKQKDKDFVILNLADIHLADLEDIFHMKTIHNELTYLIEQTKPDLITLTGDQTWSNENLLSLKCLISWLDEYKIPYAPIFGNHDYGNEKNSAVASVNYCCDLYEKGKYSLFSRGPSNLGSLGNYVINIIQDEKIFKTLYMIDSGYEDMISDQQIKWLKWNADGIKNVNNGEYSSAMCFMHKPIPEYEIAYRDYIYGNNNVEAIGEVFVTFSLSGSTQNGFFDVAKNCNVTDIVCGHQHGNNFTLKYEDVRLTFALKTGELLSYYSSDEVNLNGGTTFILTDSNVDIKNIFVNSNQFHIKNSNNIYEE